MPCQFTEEGEMEYLHPEGHALGAEGGSWLLRRERLPVAHEATRPRGCWGTTVLQTGAWWVPLEHSSRTRRPLSLPNAQGPKARPMAWTSTQTPWLRERQGALSRKRKNIIIHEGGRTREIEDVLARETWF